MSQLPYAKAKPHQSTWYQNIPHPSDIKTRPHSRHSALLKSTYPLIPTYQPSIPSTDPEDPGLSAAWLFSSSEGVVVPSPLLHGQSSTLSLRRLYTPQSARGSLSRLSMYPALVLSRRLLSRRRPDLYGALFRVGV